MGPLKTLDEVCTPRTSVFEPGVADTVYSIDDLDQIDPRRFFAENYVTEGMRLLLSEAFKRLEGRSASASGTFLLSQSMGGGKTHNLLALGLLAKHPELREQVMGSFYAPGLLGAARVVSFSGRKTNTPFGIWGEIAEQLNKREAFKDFYSPLKPPGDNDWVELLRGGPLLILLDELPPYFEAQKAVAVGSTFLDTITTTALANLLVAVNSGKLPQACAVLTDLSGAAYSAGNAAISEALANLEKEVNRSVVRIDPVRINTNELYSILRTRLFQDLPAEADAEAVAEAYRQALDRAKLMDITTASPEQLKTDIANAYPFHPAIRDLYARFKENPGFQQTRALIRIMRLIAAELWSSGAARRQYLIGAQDIDLHQQEILSEIRQINPTLETAVAHDIAATGGGSVAEQIDRGESSDAEDVCRLVFLSSLSQAVNPTLGLERSEIVRYLAAPERDLTGLTSVIDELQTEAWYLHANRDGRLLFKNTENLIAKLETYTRGKIREQREAELRDRLKEMFKLVLGNCYQQLACLPALDEVQLEQDSITLVVFQPAAEALAEITRFHDHQQFKNRVLFLTGSAAGYETVLLRAAELSAIRSILAEMHAENRPETDPQLIEGEQIKGKKEGTFYFACRETFQTIHYPSRNGLTAMELDPKYVANQYLGENQVLSALKEAYKYREDTSADGSFRTTLENKLWPPGVNEVTWSDIKRRAATDPAWVWYHPRALESLKAELVKRDIWREHGAFVERGPFPKPATSVTVQQLSRDDVTGEAMLRVRPLHADSVYMSTTGTATTASQKLTHYDLATRAPRLAFLAIDSSGEHEAGDPVAWENEIAVRHRLFQDGDQWRCELEAIPCGVISYTTDGSGPEQHGIEYSEPFLVPDGCRYVLAVVAAEGVRSQLAKIDVPSRIGDGSKGAYRPVLDPSRPASWHRAHKLDDTNAVYTWLAFAAKHQAALGGVALQVAKDKRWVELQTAPDVLQPAQTVIEYADRLKGLIEDGNVNVQVTVTRFDSGRDLQEMVRDLRTELQDGEVTQ